MGFPRPEQVRRWWEGGVTSAPESTRHARHPESEGEEPHTYAENGVGQATRQAPDGARHPDDHREDERVSGEETATSDATPDSENGLFMPHVDDNEAVSGLSGGFEEGVRHHARGPVSFDLRPGESATVEELRARRRSENEEQPRSRCIHGYQKGKGCYLCDPNHPQRLKERAAT